MYQITDALQVQRQEHGNLLLAQLSCDILFILLHVGCDPG